MGKVVVVCNQKGGVGKSTICTNLVSILAKRNDCLLVDSDRQISASRWWSERKISRPEFPQIHCVQKYDEIDATLEDLSNRYEYTVVDVPGHDSVEMRSSMLVPGATLLIPFKPSQVDLNTLTYMSKIIKDSRRINKSLIAYACLSIAPTNSKGKEIEQAKQVIAEYPEMQLLNTVIFDRKIYRDAWSEGLGVTEMQGKSDSEVNSRAEVLSLVEELLNGL